MLASSAKGDQQPTTSRFDAIDVKNIADLERQSFLDGNRLFPVFDNDGNVNIPMLLATHRSLYSAAEKQHREEWKERLKKPADLEKFRLETIAENKELEEKALKTLGIELPSFYV